MRNANYARIVVAALAAFVASSAWYTVFGGAMTELRGAGSTTPTSTGSLAGTMLFVVAQSLIVALMISYLVSRLGIADRKAALRLGALIWIFPPAFCWAPSSTRTCPRRSRPSTPATGSRSCSLWLSYSARDVKTHPSTLLVIGLRRVTREPRRSM